MNGIQNVKGAYNMPHYFLTEYIVYIPLHYTYAIYIF